jgi:NTE family protein
MDHGESKGRALVLGGGGVAGIAWMTGLLLGLKEGGVDVTSADFILGTSAGAAVGAQVASGVSLEQLYARQTDPALQADELKPGEEQSAALQACGAAAKEAADPVERRRLIGRLSLAAETVTEPVRRAVIAGRLPSEDWPDRRLGLVGVDALTGETVVFERASGASLVDAVAASCAVPCVWPPVTIGGRRYVDGGVRTSTNLDLARGYSRVLVLTLRGDEEGLFGDNPLRRQLAEIEAAGAAARAIAADPAAREAVGPSTLDPAVRAPVAAAGRAQGLAAAAAVARFWG